MAVVEVENIGKAYKKYSSHKARLAEWLLPDGKSRHQLSWVLENVSFKVNPGEAVGIVGINGAGKSTLLKMIAGTVLPTTGNVNVNGRVAALLELGMGFHPEFTGRQNVYMAGQLLGFSTDEITSLMPEIEAFAEIGEYIDQQVRVYSSGMQMRLAFSVATANRPDVLIVDEALSVGDAYFQHKSFNRIREYNKLGTTLLIVSHDRASIQSLCDHVILLNAGKLAMQGKPEVVMDYYNAMLADRQILTISQSEISEDKTQTISGTGEAGVTSIKMLDSSGKRIEVVDVGQFVRLQIEVEVFSFIPRLILGYSIKDRLGQYIFGTNTDLTKQPLTDVFPGSQYSFEIDFPANLGPGSYSVQTALVSSDTHLVNNYEWRDLALVFNVININKSHFIGCCYIEPKIVIQEE